MRSYAIKFTLLLIAQVLMWNFFNFTQFLMIVFLPAMILFMPVRQHPVITMLIAFAAGFAADFFSSGALGLTALALVPVAFLRKPVVMLVFGSELFSRDEDISVQRQGWGKIALALLILTALFLLVYILADGAGTRPLWVDIVKFAASLAASVPVSLLTADILCPESGTKWR